MGNNNLFTAMVALDEDNVKKIINEKIEKNISGKEILEELQDALGEIGKKFEKGDLFVPELIFSSVIMKDAMKIIEPLLKGDKLKSKGKVIMGTVYGDIHDIGKDLVVGILKGSGFEVIDIGINITPEKFVEAIKSEDVKLLGMSCLLTISFDGIKKTIEAIKDADLRDKIKIMIGGAPTSELVKEKTGADFYGKDAFSAVEIASEVYS